jgi:DNA polymerase-1
MTAMDGSTVEDEPRRLFLLDGHSLAYRAFFALPPTLATSSGTVTNAVYGFTSMLIKLLGDEKPDLIAVAFDMGAPTVRLQMDAEYKAGRRETPADFGPQLALIEEVLSTLRIPMIRVEGHEADDALGTLAQEASAQGIDAVIVTADRDFFQLARERSDGRGAISVLFNRRGISEIELMGPEQVEARYGVTPERYLDYVALKGDTSDNIPGVPGVGEKTAARLVQEWGSVENLVEHVDELRGKLKENVASATERLGLNKQLARIVTDLDLDIDPTDCIRGDYDPEAVRRLFTSLEFRSLLDRLQEAAGGVQPKVEPADLDLGQTDVTELAKLIHAGPAAVRLRMDDGRIVGAAVSAGEMRAVYADVDGLGGLGDPLADPASPAWTHDAKTLERLILAEGSTLATVAFDTMLAGYLLDPAAATYPLSGLSERYLGVGGGRGGGGRGAPPIRGAPRPPRRRPSRSSPP